MKLRHHARLAVMKVKKKKQDQTVQGSFLLIHYGINSNVKNRFTIIKASVLHFRKLEISFSFYMDPFSQECSFQNLLNSQQPNTSFSSDASGFGSQYVCDDDSEDEHTVSDRKGRRKWSPTEDRALISAWLNTSKDAVVGNEQKLSAFWKRIANYFAACPKVSALQQRGPTQCKQRWRKLNEGVCKFVGCYAAARKQKSSGQSEDDVLKVAHQIFYNDFKLKFTMEHAWLELRHDQKWCGASETKDKVSSKRKSDHQTESSVPVCDGEDEGKRPIGVKAAKAKGKSKKKISEEDVEFVNMWEIRQKDFDLKDKLFVFKDKLNKQKIPNRLMNQTEPLTELEISLKNKLMTEMLSSGLLCLSRDGRLSLMFS
ncbi:No apical meristem-associated [Hirschfeldia incana]|nr:No apical meristem-associated [Hirschfeldia incana]